MTKTEKSHKQRFTCFKNGFCPYCGAGEATLEPIKNKRGFRAACTNPDCKAENFFTNEKAQEWIKQ